MITASIIMTTASCSITVGWRYKKVHICANGIDKCIPIEQGFFDSDGVEIRSSEYGVIFLSNGTYILIIDKCPICDAKK